MDTATFNEYVEKRYDDQLKYYGKASAKNQKRYKNLQWILIILSTITTILAALPRSDEFDVQYLVVVSAGLVTIITAGLKTFQYQELWVNYRSTIEQLKPEIYYYNFNVGDYGQAGVDKEALFVSRVEKILNKEHDAWPVFKKLGDQDNLQANDDLQRKLDELVREKLKTQKINQANDTTDTENLTEKTVAEQTEETIDSKPAEEPTDTEITIEPGGTTSDDMAEDTNAGKGNDEKGKIPIVS